MWCCTPLLQAMTHHVRTYWVWHHPRRIPEGQPCVILCHLCQDCVVWPRWWLRKSRHNIIRHQCSSMRNSHNVPVRIGVQVHQTRSESHAVLRKWAQYRMSRHPHKTVPASGIKHDAPTYGNHMRTNFHCTLLSIWRIQVAQDDSRATANPPYTKSPAMAGLFVYICMNILQNTAPVRVHVHHHRHMCMIHLRKVP